MEAAFDFMPVVTPSKLPPDFTQLVRVERDGNPLRRFGHASPFIGKLAALQADALDTIARSTWQALPPMQGRTLVIGMTESSLLLGWFLAHQAPTPVELRFTTRETRRLASGLNWRTFEEPHSHGPLHFLALEDDVRFDQIVIIEDELTTGATLRNLLLQLQDISSRFYVVTLNDMRPLEAKAQLLYDMVERGCDIQTFDLSQIKTSRHVVPNGSSRLQPCSFNPFQRHASDWSAAQDALLESYQRFEFGAVYVVGECVDVPLAFWATLPTSQRPAIQHITRSPWKVDCKTIQARIDFAGDGSSSRYFLYNFALLSPRALLVHDASTAVIADQARDFLTQQGIQAQSVEVAGT